MSERNKKPKDDEPADQDDHRLLQWMTDYDEALAVETSPPGSDDLTTKMAPEMVARFESAKQCLDVLDRVRRQGFPHLLDGNEIEAAPFPVSEIPTASLSLGLEKGTNGLQGELPKSIGHFQIERELGRGGCSVFCSHAR